MRGGASAPGASSQSNQSNDPGDHGSAHLVTKQITVTQTQSHPAVDGRQVQRQRVESDPHASGSADRRAEPEGGTTLAEQVDCSKVTRSNGDVRCDELHSMWAGCDDDPVPDGTSKVADVTLGDDFAGKQPRSVTTWRSRGR